MSSIAMPDAKSGENRSVCLVVLNEFTNDSRVLKEALSLQKAGYVVQVLALHALGLPLEELVSGIPVRRVKLWTRGWSKRKPVQIMKYAEFVLKALCFCKNFDILHCNDLDALPVGVVSKWLHFGRQRVVYDAHEFEIDCDGPASRKRIRAKARLEGALIRHADAVMTVSASIAKAYRRIYRIKTPTLVLNCPPFRETAESFNRFREEYGIRADQKIFLYQGGLSSGRGIEKILQVFCELPNDDFVVVFMGYGSLEGLVKSAASQNDKIFYKPAVSPVDLLNYTASADFGLVFIENTCKSYSWCLPNKIFEYLMAGIVIICSDLIELRHLIKMANMGFCIKGESFKDLKEGIQKIQSVDKADTVRKSRLARQIYCWETQEKSLWGVYSSLYCRDTVGRDING